MTRKRLSFTIADVREMAKRFSNWGRWGDDDELGTVNFITPEKVASAARLARTGKILASRSRSTPTVRRQEVRPRRTRSTT